MGCPRIALLPSWCLHGLRVYPSETVVISCSLGRRQFSHSSPFANRRVSKREKPRFRDAYAIKQEEARKAANLARGAETKARRAAAVGDPIRGAAETTPFVKSLDNAIDPTKSMSNPVHELHPTPSSSPTVQATESAFAETSPGLRTFDQKSADLIAGAQLPSTGKDQLNHFFTTEDLKNALDTSEALSAPYVPVDRSAADPAKEEEARRKHNLQDTTRREAVARIMSPQNASSKQRTMINTQRCIEIFGRHNTDVIFRQQTAVRDPDSWQSTERAGVDTGSSEVQVALLTAKIRVLMTAFEGRSRNDKVNKRNLRLLLHRRQKLLKYFEKKDRGGPRWQHLLSTLGLTPATWKGEINVR